VQRRPGRDPRRHLQRPRPGRDPRGSWRHRPRACLGAPGGGGARRLRLRLQEQLTPERAGGSQRSRCNREPGRRSANWCVARSRRGSGRRRPGAGAVLHPRSGDADLIGRPVAQAPPRTSSEQIAGRKRDDRGSGRNHFMEGQGRGRPAPQRATGFAPRSDQTLDLRKRNSHSSCGLDPAHAKHQQPGPGQGQGIRPVTVCALPGGKDRELAGQMPGCRPTP
jgi:hypothetical protein